MAQEVTSRFRLHHFRLHYVASDFTYVASLQTSPTSLQTSPTSLQTSPIYSLPRFRLSLFFKLSQIRHQAGTCESRNAGTRNGTRNGLERNFFCYPVPRSRYILHLQIPIAHCLPPAPQDTCCTSKNTSDTLSQCLHLQLASCTFSWTYCEPADFTMLPGQKIQEENVLSIFLKLPAQSYNDLILTPVVSGGIEGKQYLEVKEARWLSGGAGGKQWVGVWRCTRQGVGIWRYSYHAVFRL